MKSCKVFAPASVGNVAVGFDIMGFATSGVGDVVEAFVDTKNLKSEDSGECVAIERIEGPAQIPIDPSKNTASIAVKSLLVSQKIPFHVKLKIKKGIPLSSGMGGSAASAVAAVVAVNELLGQPVPKHELLLHALEGESFASGSHHADNVAPSLYGGLVLIAGDRNQDLISLPVPHEIHYILVHPQLKIETKQARSILKSTVGFNEFVTQSSNLAGFICACYNNNIELIGKCLKDIIVEPQRSHLIPDFESIKKAAIQKGALGFSISGAGPSVFAWAESSQVARDVEAAIVGAFQKNNLSVRSWVDQIPETGAYVID